MLASDKDGSATLNLHPSSEFKFFFDDSPRCRIKRNNSRKRDDFKEAGREYGLEVPHQLEEQDDRVEIQDGKQEDNFNMFVASSLKIKIPSLEESRVPLEDDDIDEGMKTPTSLDRKISVSFNSPPGAPRKPKALPLKKRKANCRCSRLLLHLNSSEFESLFPPIVSADLISGDLKINKKSRQQGS